MDGTELLRLAVRGASLAALGLLAACGSMRSGEREQLCLARAMYFESNRSSEEGMLAVGTVVMNRVASDKFPDTVCKVVGQKNQFAPGVLSKPMTEQKSRERAMKVAAQVLRGKRHRAVGSKAMFFHTAGYSFPYDNMHYTVIAGGNAFYEKRTARAGQRNRTQMEAARGLPLTRPAAAPVQMAAMRPAAAPVQAWQPPPAPVQAWQPGPPPAAYSVAPAAPGPGSIEDLILMNGG
jgi:spore germination cell wall hydrolase CwlJ-like protein